MSGEAFTTWELEDDSFTKWFVNHPPEHLQRIFSISQHLSDTGIGPKILKLTANSITYERVEAFDQNLPCPRELIPEIREAVRNMHALGYGHGDLHMGNIGRKDGKIVILDHDTMYYIDVGMTPWIEDWIRRGYEEEITFEEFVEKDYTNWR